MRIAFLTPEYVIDYPNSGGLASYVARMARTLVAMGHHVEVFTLSDHPRLINHEGIRVEHVTPIASMPLRFLGGHWRSQLLFSGSISQLSGAQAMGRALKLRERTVSFDLVQSSDYGLSGAYVPRRKNRIHVMRCSWSRKLYEQHAMSRNVVDSRVVAWQERGCFHRADVVYAPSRFMANALSDEFGVPVHTLRPPLLTPQAVSSALKPSHLPNRYMIHFGQLSRIKGTDLLAQVLLAVWRKVPDFHLVLAGKVQTPGLMDWLKNAWGERAGQVRWVGSVPRPQLYATLLHADAAILPSRCDNLPNTVIESLCLGVPVIGSAGASIDELVTDNETGKLVAIGDVEALADAIVQLWHCPLQFTHARLRQHPTFKQMVPHVAATSLLELNRNLPTTLLAQAA